MPSPAPTDRVGIVTHLLLEAEVGDPSGLVERLLPHVYDELLVIARAQRHRQGASATLATTDLVHEAYLRLVGCDLVPNRRYVFAAAAQAMRNVLVDHARRRSAQKRGRPVTLDPERYPAADLDREAARLLDVHDALGRLAAFDPRAAQVVECRFFGGLSVEETAEVVGTGTATVKRDWRRARAWLQTQLGGEADTPLPVVRLDGEAEEAGDPEPARAAEGGQPPPPDA